MFRGDPPVDDPAPGNGRERGGVGIGGGEEEEVVVEGRERQGSINQFVVEFSISVSSLHTKVTRVVSQSRETNG